MKTTSTPEFFFNDLPSEECVRAIHNQVAHKNEIYDAKKGCKNVCDALEAFIWADTAQGHNYWFDIYYREAKNIQNKMTSILPEQKINNRIKGDGINTNLISDGYHTFGELYSHRITLFIALCRYKEGQGWNGEATGVWRSKKHSDGSVWDGWFILGINKLPGEQITYHLPDKEWDNCSFAETLDQAPEFDGHTSSDVLERLKLM